MGKITAIFDDQDKSKEERVVVMIDGKYCMKVRKRTFSAMNLNVGDSITCEQLKEDEKFHWKKTYNTTSWEKEQVRLEKVKKFVYSIRNDLVVKETGFGAGKTEFIAEHPNESGAPDLTVYKNGQSCMYIEVTGTEYKRGTEYWLRPDKIQYFNSHPEKNIWFVLYFNSENQLVFIKPERDKKYTPTLKMINGSGENMVEFSDDDDEVKGIDTFIEAIKTIK